MSDDTPVVDAEGRIHIPKDRPMTDSEQLAVVRRFVEDWSLCRDRDLRWNLCRALGWKLPENAVP